MSELPTPFQIPKRPHRRRHAPLGYTNYSEYKPWLRDEFSFRCVYCLEREMWYPSQSAAFSVDHFVPLAIDPSRVSDYANLVYSCNRCNSAKRDDASLLNPTTTNFARHIRVDADGTIHGLTMIGRRLIGVLKLDGVIPTRVRRETLQILRAKQAYPDDEVIHGLYLARFGYPDDLPDLRRLRPPGKNGNAGSEQDCYFARRERGELAAIY